MGGGGFSAKKNSPGNPSLYIRTGVPHTHKKEQDIFRLVYKYEILHKGGNKDVGVISGFLQSLAIFSTDWLLVQFCKMR